VKRSTHPVRHAVGFASDSRDSRTKNSGLHNAKAKDDRRHSSPSRYKARRRCRKLAPPPWCARAGAGVYL
jgi:hypothetical protein